ncbi:MAG: diphthine--ammonia ligase [archaeon]|nr:MAG: diphthine--ammonia ligase [archaeon]
MKLGVLFSGGKDSTYSGFLYKKELVCLISILSENPDSYMFQQVSKDKIEKIAKKIGLPIIFQKTKGEKEEELVDLEKAIQNAKEKFKIDGIVTGAVASNYQKLRIQKICDKLKLKCFNPIWRISAEEYWKKLISNNFKVRIVKVAADGLDNSWVGRIIDDENLEGLKKLSEKFRFDLRFEGGEAETEVVDCPLFKH